MGNIQSTKDGIDELLIKAYEEKASDVHITSGEMPFMRKNGELLSIGAERGIFSQEEMRQFAMQCLDQLHIKGEFLSGSVDASYSVSIPSGVFHCRVNAFYDSNGISMAFRILRNDIPTMEQLRLPRSIQKLCHLEHGLVCVTGATGQGKSTTIASMLNAINETRSARIITIENPIEYRFERIKSVISQREVGRDCASFIEGLRDVLRQDPDVILIGEMRDAETVETALAAAETGHLVFATLHAATVAEAIDRFMQYFPAERHQEIRNELANSFEAIVAQRLFPSVTGGRVAAFEIMLAEDATRNVIRSGKGFRLRDYMFQDRGMQTMEDAIQGLRNKKLIRSTTPA